MAWRTTKICIAMSWSADYAASRARAAAAGIKVNLAFTVPKEGANESFDALLIPTGAPHPHAAHQFLNFILRAESHRGDYQRNSLRQRQPGRQPLCGSGHPERSRHLSDRRDRAPALPHGGSQSRHRAHPHAYLDANQDRALRALAAPPSRFSARRPAAPAARRRSVRRITTPATMTQTPTAQMIRLASALMSGLTPSLTLE